MICLALIQAVALVGGTVHAMSSATGLAPADERAAGPGILADSLILDGLIQALGPGRAVPIWL